MTCTPTKGKGRAKKVTVVCRVKLAAAASAAVRARFLQGHRVVAAARGSSAHGVLSLRVAHMTRGRYTLLLTTTTHGRRTTVRQPVRVSYKRR